MRAKAEAAEADENDEPRRKSIGVVAGNPRDPEGDANGAADGSIAGRLKSSSGEVVE